MVDRLIYSLLIANHNLIATQERFSLTNQLFASGHAIRRDTLRLSVQIVVAFQTGKIIAGMRLLDNLVGSLAPFGGFSVQITFSQRMLK